MYNVFVCMHCWQSHGALQCCGHVDDRHGHLFGSAFGDAITSDHLAPNSPPCEALGGSRYAMVVLGVGTRWRDVDLAAEQDATDSRLALLELI